MPKSKALQVSHRRPVKPAARSVRGGQPSPPASHDYSYVVQGGEPAFVLVPVDEYEKFVLNDMVRSATRKLAEDEQGKIKWVKAEDVAMRLASDRIVEARKAAGLTQKQLGEKLHMPQSQISRIERNPDHTTVRTIQKVARALGLDVSAFVGYCLPNGRRKRG